MKNKLITNPFISHLELHLSCFGKVKSISSLRDLLSRFLNIGDTFSFRNSTTNAFIDVLQILLADTTYRVIYTNLENPSILNAIENFVPKNRRVQLDLMKLLLEGKFDEILVGALVLRIVVSGCGGVFDGAVIGHGSVSERS